MSQVILFNTSCAVNFEVLVNFEHELMLKRRIKTDTLYQMPDTVQEQQIQVNLLEL